MRTVIHNSGLILIGLGLSLGADAGDWRFASNVSVEEIYSDNIDLEADNEQSDQLTRISPKISLRGEGRHLDVDFSYQLTEQRSQHDASRSQATHQLSTNGQAELAERTFFLDFSGNVSQQSINNVNNAGLNENVVDNDNVDDVYTLEISPFFVHRLGQYVSTEGRTRWNKVFNQSEQVEDSVSIENSFTVRSGEYFTVVPWRVTYRDSVVTEDGQDDQEFSSLDARVSYIINHSYTTFVNLGYEDNTFDSNDSDVDQNSVTWSVGVAWTPSTRTLLEALWGKGAFGNTFGLDFSHRSRRSVWTATYNEQITNARSEQLAFAPLQSLLVGRNEIVSPNVFVALPTLVNEVFISRSFLLGVAFRGQRSDASWELFYNARTFQESEEDERVFGVRLGFTRSLTPKTSFNVTADWEQTAFRDDVLDGEDEVWSIGVGLTKRLTPNSSLALRLEHRVRSSDDANNEFTENNASLSWSLAL